MPESRTIYCERALLPDGWATQVSVTVDAGGAIAAVERDQPRVPVGAECPRGVVVPGIPNCHSHAFQRAMVGLTERRGGGEDSFWSWRDAMYRLLGHIGPEELQAVAEQLYIEMLKQGYTSVAEFHYLHHDGEGRPYDDPAEMSHRVIAAARSAGIHITHLPVLYCHSDFGARPPEPGQRRFVHSPAAYQDLLERLHSAYGQQSDVRLGAAPHSLRAVSEPLLRDAIAGLDRLDGDAPIHIHIAEQEREVEGSLAHSGSRPVAWLLDQFDVGPRWCLVHATHIDSYECARLAASGAVVGLCPTTEANLGDGIFPAPDYLAAGGGMAIGSDSQVTLDPAQELRLLEYGQRLSRRRRTLLADPAQPSVGEYLMRRVLAGGARALGINAGAIAPGARADLVVLDDSHPVLYGKQGAALLDSWVFGCNSTPVKDVMVGGEWRIQGGVHALEGEVAERFRAAVGRLS
jgi:formimidoylglutamate deiminase